VRGVSSSAVSRTASSWLRSRAGRRVARPAGVDEANADEQPTHRGIVSAGVRSRRESQRQRSPETFDELVRSLAARRFWR
jgi:hypothetical protein